jgi:hypothetical protein
VTCWESSSERNVKEKELTMPYSYKSKISRVKRPFVKILIIENAHNKIEIK